MLNLTSQIITKQTLSRQITRQAAALSTTSSLFPSTTLPKPSKPNSSFSSNHQSRKMSTTTKPKNEYLVQIPDFPSSLEKRLAARPTHLSNLKPAIEAGSVVFGGATLSEPIKDGETPQMTGSVMLIVAESEEEVWRRLREDPYTKGGAWDVENAKVWNFKCAVRTAL